MKQTQNTRIRVLSGERRSGGVLSGKTNGGGSHWGRVERWQRALWYEREGDCSLSGRPGVKTPDARRR